MRSFALSILLAGPALAGELAQAVGGVAIGLPAPAPAPTQPPVATPVGLDRRAIDRNCLSSIVSELSPPTTGVDSKLLSWATRQATLGAAPPRCTITAPASLSSAYSSYLDILKTYFSTLESKAKGINTKCGADVVSLTFSQGCSTSLTVLYTDAIATKTSSYANVEIPKKTIYLGEGSGSGSGNGGGSGGSKDSSAAVVSGPIMGSAAAFAAVLAVALAL
ncbi:hypothetical protein PCL_03943 [Purpureocillium lilacinum]|uniref:Infection structure specific protein n=1 Tax=Purpureocillium lilacinum TaxID=33203 RepID=A0A2U3EQG8_PURLI|nr:hypothetical protein PCL_03943 [Purpureocillium lilacinum]